MTTYRSMVRDSGVDELKKFSEGMDITENGKTVIHNVQWAYGKPNQRKFDFTNWKYVDLTVHNSGKVTSGMSLVIINDMHECQIDTFTDNYLLRITVSNSSFLFKFKDLKDYKTFLSVAILWKNLRGEGVLNKWNYEERVVEGVEEELLVTEVKACVPGGEWGNVTARITSHGVIECEAMVLDVKLLFESEIRVLHPSMYDNSNVLYIGVIETLRRSHHINEKTKSKLLIEFTTRSELEKWHDVIKSFTREEYLGNPYINDLRIRCHRQISLEIMECQFNEKYKNIGDSWFYCELIMWDVSWFRSAIVQMDDTMCVFWKEIVELELPMSTNAEMKILIKKASSAEMYECEGEDSDEIIGSCFIRGDGGKVLVYNLRNLVIGELVVNLDKCENNILPVEKYKSFANIMRNSRISSLISYIEPKCTTGNLEKISVLLLDIYQFFQREDEYLAALIKYELCDGRVREPLKFSTIFRGNSMLSKSLEKYTLRVGHEYLEKLLGGFINKIQMEDLNCECDPKLDPAGYLENYANLVRYLEELWERIYSTTNDIPMEIKRQWKQLRVNVEMLVGGDADGEVSCNAISSFIFLRFFCPAIMNPKLYGLSEVHYSGRVSRTLVLIAKVLMMMCNRSRFQQHKESYLVPLNDFLEKRESEVVNYFDKVTLKTMDFSEKKLEMSGEKSVVVDKYLCLQKLVGVFGEEGGEEVEESGGYQIEGFDDIEDDFLTLMINEEDETFGGLLDKKEFAVGEVRKSAGKLVREGRRVQSGLQQSEVPWMMGEKWEEFVEAVYSKEVGLVELLDQLKMVREVKVVREVKEVKEVIEDKVDKEEDKKKWFKLFKRRSRVI